MKIAMIVAFLSASTGSPFIFTSSLLILAGVIGLIAGVMASKWLFVSIFMIFLGGMMILFFYVVSLSKASVNTFYLTWKETLFLVFFLFTSYSDLTWDSFFLKEMYYYTGVQLLVVLAMYLFFCLMAVVKISQSFKGSLSSKW